MLASLSKDLVTGAEWVYEEKYDGIRAVAYRDGDRVRLLSRTGQDLTAGFSAIVDAIRNLPDPDLVLDGELVVFDKSGVSRFQLLQRRGDDDAATAPVFVVFDCLYARGRDLRGRPLAERRAVLERELREHRALRLARRLAGDGFKAFAAAQRRGLEGVIAKDATSLYVPGTRSPLWRKVKVRAEEEFVIGGFTAPEGSRAHFGALLVGAWAGDTLRYAGKVGTGFTGRTLDDLMRRFRPLVRATSPFTGAPRERGVTWVEPTLVAQLGFTEWTGDGKLRHPTFLGLRDDKPARQVRWPEAQTA